MTFTLRTCRTLLFVAVTLTILSTATADSPIIYPQPPVGGPPVGGWYNPEIYNSGRQVSGVQYDPFTGRVIVRTDQTKVRESVLDPNRGNIDPGSYQRVNRYETDVNGVQWHVTGTQWTSNGVPHGNLSRRRVGGVHHGGGVVEDKNEHVIFSPGNTPHPQPPRPQPGRPTYSPGYGRPPMQGGGGVVEDRNEHVIFDANPGRQQSAKPPVRTPSYPSFNRGSSQGSNNRLRQNLRSFGRSFNPFN